MPNSTVSSNALQDPYLELVARCNELPAELKLIVVKHVLLEGEEDLERHNVYSYIDIMEEFGVPLATSFPCFRNLIPEAFYRNATVQVEPEEPEVKVSGRREILWFPAPPMNKFIHHLVVNFTCGYHEDRPAVAAPAFLRQLASGRAGFENLKTLDIRIWLEAEGSDPAFDSLKGVEQALWKLHKEGGLRFKISGELKISVDQHVCGRDPCRDFDSPFQYRHSDCYWYDIAVKVFSVAPNSAGRKRFSFKRDPKINGGPKLDFCEWNAYA